MSTQGIDERMINVHYYYYYICAALTFHIFARYMGTNEAKQKAQTRTKFNIDIKVHFRQAVAILDSFAASVQCTQRFAAVPKGIRTCILSIESAMPSPLGHTENLYALYWRTRPFQCHRRSMCHVPSVSCTWHIQVSI